MKHVLTVAFGAVLALPGMAQDPDTIRARLEHQRVSVDFVATPLRQVMRYLQEAAGVNLVLDRSVEGRGDLPVTLRVRDLPLKLVLKLALQGHGLVATLDAGVVLVQPREKVEQKVTTRMYDVTDLLHQVEDFPGPTIELPAPESDRPFTLPIDFADEPESVVTSEFLEDLIRQSTGTRSWDANPAASMMLVGGTLVVTQNARIHREIERLLLLLRQYR